MLTAPAATLTAQVDRILADAGLQAAPLLPGGHPVGDGYLVEPMLQCGPARAAVRWHHVGPQTDCTGLDLCRDALTTARYRVEIVHAAPGPYLAVLPPPGS